jgi:phenylpyruvate tautomerase PptA (4-oxalocrotonate tautomerase family)
MPYIQVTVGQKLSDPQKEALKSELGRLIAIIPGKAEADLIVSIQDGGSLYMGGIKAPSVYIDLRVYTAVDPEAKKHFARELFSSITRQLGIPSSRQYLTIGEYDHWGYDGEFH